MSYTTTPALSLKKDNADEPIINLRTHNNDNLDAIDTTVGNLVKAINNAKVLLGQLGYDQNGQPVVSASTARANLDAAQSENAAGSLYDAEQAIGTNASAIASLQDSVSTSYELTGTNVGTLVSPHTWRNDGSANRVYKRNGVACINIGIQLGSSVNVATTAQLMTLPSGYRPKSATHMLYVDGSTVIEVIVEGNGNISITPTVNYPSGSPVWIRGTYLV